MDAKIRLVTAVLLMSVASLGAQVSTDTVVTWKEQQWSLGSLAEEQGLGEAIATVESWAPWAAEREYRLVLSQDASVLLVLSESYARRNRGRREDRTMLRFLSSVEKTIATVDLMLFSKEQSDDVTRTVTVIGVKEKDYEGVLGEIADRNESLRAWTSAAARSSAGFSLPEPLLGVWIEDPSGVDEYNRENEIVHRTAAGMLARYAPNLPKWFQLGLAWHVEDRVMDSVYCFPYRSSFVSIYDHTDWDRNLMQAFKRRRNAPLELREVAEWNPREGYDEDKGQIAFGLSRYLADHRTKSLAPLLVELNEQITEKRKVPTGARTWTVDTNYRLPIAEQIEMFERHAGDDLFAEATAYFIAGKAYKPGDKRGGANAPRN